MFVINLENFPPGLNHHHLHKKNNNNKKKNQ